MSARASAAHELLRRRAIDVGLCEASASGDDTSAAIEALIEREVAVPAPGDEECRRWYDAHPETFVAGELVLARHILFAVTPRMPLEALRRKAEETLHELGRSPERFAELARERSNCPSGAHGGVLGQLGRGDCVPEFERALFASSATGVLPTLVNTRYGFHVVCVERRAPGHRVPFDEVRADIAARLARRSWERALVQYVQVLEQAREGGAANPLVQ